MADHCYEDLDFDEERPFAFGLQLPLDIGFFPGTGSNPGQHRLLLLPDDLDFPVFFDLVAGIDAPCVSPPSKRN